MEQQTSDEAVLKCGRAVLEHHFDNHKDCGEWCRRKTQTAEERKKHFYRSKEKDKLLYDELKRIMARFLTLEALREVAHTMDTNANESLNNTISWIAPKNKVLCGTVSLAVRIAIAIGITSLGTKTYYNELFRLLGITITEDVAHWLEIRDGTRSRRLAKAKTRDYKLRRNKRAFDKLKDETQLAKDERAKREGVYEAGIGMGGGYGTDADDDDNGDSNQKKKKQSTRLPKKDMSKTCKACHEQGHATRRNKLCQLYVAPPPRRSKKKVAPTAASITPHQAFATDADELDALDAMPLEDPAGSSEDDFFDARDTYSDDSGSAGGAERVQYDVAVGSSSAII